jgi:tripartite motif-containing protein 71
MLIRYSLLLITAVHALSSSVAAQPQFLMKWGSGGNVDGQFSGPTEGAVDDSGNVYIVTQGYHRIQKFTSEGTFITKWGSEGSADGQFRTPYGIAIDNGGYVYVTDVNNHRIQKFTSNGTFITKWGSEGSGDGQFIQPTGVAVDDSGNVYVAGGGNRIQRFSGDGTFLDQWGSSGTGDAEFNDPRGVTIDGAGNVYVVDFWNHRIQKFTSEGTFITKWGSEGSADGQFNLPSAVAVDSADCIYISELNNHRIQKFTSEGTFITKWGSEGSADGQFIFPIGIVIGNNGDIYIVDNGHNRIQMFGTPNPVVEVAPPHIMLKWGTFGDGDGQLRAPYGVAVDNSGYVYVADTGNNRIQKFTNDGTFIAKWGDFPSSMDGFFSSPNRIAFDDSGQLYVLDVGNNRIQKFTGAFTFLTKWNVVNPKAIGVSTESHIYVAYHLGVNRVGEYMADGTFITNWGSSGRGPGQFYEPTDIEVDHSGNIYIVDSQNYRIQKITSDGTFIADWGSQGTADRQFDRPSAVAVDGVGDVYVSERYNHRVQKFTVDGFRIEFVTKWGNEGSGDGQFLQPNDIALDNGGTIYIADTGNNRIQRFDTLPIGSRGDINLDGEVSILDVVKNVRSIVGSSPTPDAGSTAYYIADANADGAIDVADVIHQINLIFGISPKLLATAPSSPVTVNLNPVQLGSDGWRTVPVSLHSDGLISGIQAAFSFDPSIIEIGTPVTDSDLVIESHLDNGNLRVVLYGTGQYLATGHSTAIQIPVRTTGDDPSITLDTVIIVDSQAQRLSVQLGTITVPITKDEARIPVSFALNVAVPNPFNPTTIIAYEVSEQSHITLVVYNMLGQEVARLVDQVQTAGRYDVLWNGTNSRGHAVSSGIYMYRLTSSTGFTETKKMTLLK